MKKTFSVLASGLFLLGTPVVHAEQLPSEIKPAEVIVENVGGHPIACGLLFAHWYREDFKTMSPGASVTLPMKFSPPTEAVYVINSVNHPMAVQDLFCAASGTDWKKVTHLDYRALAMKAADQGKPLHLKCSSDKTALSCENYTQ
jgi:hypothetical protein